MATITSAIRDNNFYLGFALESSPGTPVAPSLFPRWNDGSKVDYNLGTKEVWEGDGTRHLSMIIKNQQSLTITLNANLRANELGFFLNGALGSGADTYTAPTVSTTLSSSASAGATSVSVAGNTGLTGSGTIALVLGAGTASEEIATFNLPVTGGGPYTLTVDSTYNGGALKLAHTSSSTVKSSASHVLIDQSDGNYYTVEAGLGSLNGANGTTLRIRSCKIDSMKISGKMGDLIVAEIIMTGIASTVQGSPATVTLEPHLPFLYVQALGAWNLDGSVSSADAKAISDFDLTIQNNLDTGIQTEDIVLNALTYGHIAIVFNCTLIFNSPQRIYAAYYGGSSGTTDATTIGLGSFAVTFSQPDGLQTFALNILTLAYTKVTLPEPKNDGKHFETKVSGQSIASSATGATNPYLLQATLTNTQYASY